MVWPLGEAAQLSSDSCPDQLYEKPVPKKKKDQVAQRQRIVSGNGGRPGLFPFLDHQCWCQSMQIQNIDKNTPLACDFTAAEAW